jgi:polyhydroxyalkanoate synthesis regulator phasin
MKKIPVKNEALVRDSKTGALLSTDLDAVKAYERKKQEMKAQKERINRLEEEIADLKKAIAALLQQRNGK